MSDWYIEYHCYDTPQPFPTPPPTLRPTPGPSDQPSPNPTKEPSEQPSNVPSRHPTKSPISPTDFPTIDPSKSPSQDPTYRPSAIPSLEPSALPTLTPSFNPTMTPVVNQTNPPSEYPTLRPSNVPSFQPSEIPTKVPTQPTLIPSEIPSLDPSKFPSTDPSNFPSSQPTTEPSSQPTHNPTAQPSITPTVQPSPQPSMEPSSEPTMPTLSSAPTERPTWGARPPSEPPTMSPTLENTPAAIIITKTKTNGIDQELLLILVIAFLSLVICLVCIGVIFCIRYQRQQKLLIEGISNARYKQALLDNNINNNDNQTTDSFGNVVKNSVPAEQGSEAKSRPVPPVKKPRISIIPGAMDERIQKKQRVRASVANVMARNKELDKLKPGIIDIPNGAGNNKYANRLSVAPGAGGAGRMSIMNKEGRAEAAPAAFSLNFSFDAKSGNVSMAAARETDYYEGFTSYTGDLPLSFGSEGGANLKELEAIKAAQKAEEKEKRIKKQLQFAQVLGDAQVAENMVFDELVEEIDEGPNKPQDPSTPGIVEENEDPAEAGGYETKPLDLEESDSGNNNNNNNTRKNRGDNDVNGENYGYDKNENENENDDNYNNNNVTLVSGEDEDYENANKNKNMGYGQNVNNGYGGHNGNISRTVSTKLGQAVSNVGSGGNSDNEDDALLGGDNDDDGDGDGGMMTIGGGLLNEDDETEVTDHDNIDGMGNMDDIDEDDDELDDDLVTAGMGI